ncbi:MAG: sigma-70 family RNA polymerase sigma factor [Planctomycetota bacterium]|nr:sigma-70 family RNA polymerase sigma factor [Planctomycetota bacterium]
MLRQRRRQRVREDRAGPRGADSSREPEPHAAAEASEQLNAVRAELEALPDLERLPLVLHYQAGLDYQRIAKTLGCPVNTAKTRVHRGMERLRRRLALLGLILAYGQLERLLGAPAEAAESGRADAPEPNPSWQRLLHSSQTPQLPPFNPMRRWSTMAKLGTFAAALALASLLGLAASSLRGSERAATQDRSPARPDAQSSQTDRGPRGEAVQEDTGPLKGDMNPATEEEKQAIAAGVNALGMDLYAKLAGGQERNFFFSPYSISTALGMTYAGAKGNTAREMEQGLRFKLAGERFHAACAGLIQELNAPRKDGQPRGFKLAVANRLFGAKKYEFLPAFLELNEKQYGAPLERLDFAGATEASRKAINTWVEDRTQEKIKELILAGQLTPDAVLVLVNAIYFKGDWSSPFSKSNTRPEPFHLTALKRVDAPTMHRTLKARYYEDADVLQALELPYVNGELSMLILLPRRVDGLAGIEGRLSVGNLDTWRGGMREEDVQVALPKFKVTWGAEDIRPALQKLGVKDLFAYGPCDLSGMDGSRMLYVSLVLHKAFVDVNEEGTEAAAATAVVVKPGAPPPRERKEPKVFKADRPFVFAIRDNASGAILFMGRVADPTKE